jgi:hypothetical protein
VSAEPLGRPPCGFERSIVPAPELVPELGGVPLPLGLLPMVPLPGLPGLAPGVWSLELREPDRMVGSLRSPGVARGGWVGEPDGLPVASRCWTRPDESGVVPLCCARAAGTANAAATADAIAMSLRRFICPLESRFK